MRRRNGTIQRIGNGLAFGLIILGWLLFAPQHLGGQAIFVIVNGNSMEPVYYRDDLVIARAATTYAVGDIVTYQHPEIGPVIHRIIGREGEQWIFQGDNNDFIDPYRPTSAELIGRSWLHIPSAGGQIAKVRGSPLLPILAFGIVLMTVIRPNMKPPRAHKRHRRNSGPGGSGGNPQLREWGMTIFGVLSLAALVLTIFAYLQPIANEESVPIDYQQSGRFDYRADAPAGIYDTDQVQAGEPVFFQLSPLLQITFDYRFESAEAANLQGTASMIAELSSSNGWHRTIVLADRQQFTETAITLGGELDLNEIRRLIAQYETTTNLERQQYELTLMPQVEIDGTLAFLPLRESFAPQLVFRLDETQLRIHPGDSGIDAQFSPGQSGMLSRTVSEPNRMGLAGIEVDVPQVRLGGLIATGLFLTLSAVTGVPLLLAARRDQDTRNKLKYGSLMVDMVGSTAPHGRQEIHLASIDDLARLAERYGATIMRDPHANPVRYVLFDNDTAYVFQAGNLSDRPTFDPANEPAAHDIDAEEPAPSELEASEAPPQNWQTVFLQTLRDTGLATEAARVAEIDIVTAYRERAHSPEFAQAWREARIYFSQQFNPKRSRR